MRTQRELNLQVALAFALSLSRGYAFPDTGKEMARTLQICRELGDIPELFAVFWGLWTYYIVAAELSAARQMGERLLGIALSTGNSTLLLGAHTALGTTLHHQGELAAAHDHLERAVALHDPSQIRSYIALYRADPGLVSRSQSIRSLYLLGYPDQSCRRAHETLALARQGPDPARVGFPLGFAAQLYQFTQQAEKALELADECLALSGEFGIPNEQAWAKCVRGWATAERGQVEAGMAEIREGLAALRAVGCEAGRPQFLAFLADAARKAGKTEEALAAVAEGLAEAHRTGDHLYDAELHRLRGELLLVESAASASDVEACFHQAIETARGQTAKAFELRAVMSLARLWQRQGKTNEAREKLREIYGWFTEGFDTADLKEVKALLQEIS